MLLSELEQEALWDLPLPTEYVPGTSRPEVDVVPDLCHHLGLGTGLNHR